MDIPEKPPTPEPPREATPGAYLPPKLREKLEAADEGGGDDWEPKGSSPLPWIILAVLVLGGGAWGFMAMRANAAKSKAAEEARVAEVRADSIAAAARADSLRALAQDTTATAAAGTSTSTPAAGTPPGRTAAASGTSPAGQASSKGGQGAGTAPATSGGPYGLEVATYLFEDRAQSEKERLATATGLQARVVTRTEGGATVYRLVLGSFDSRSAAERKAEQLTGENVVSQASVIPLK